MGGGGQPNRERAGFKSSNSFKSEKMCGLSLTFNLLKTGSRMGLLLIAAGTCFGFILFNQEMLYWQASQKRGHQLCNFWL